MHLRFMKLVAAAFGVVAILVWFGLSIGSIDSMPYWAVGFLDDADKSFIALPCIDEWRTRPTRSVDVVRRGTAGEAYKLGNKMDDQCREAGGYSEDGRSVIGLMLVRLGVLSPLTHWWDKPYRTEDGAIVYPDK
jgi:hypothetical protein